MAHVPRREPCKSCGNPVFLAERLTIDKYLFHRTCLKCARCNTQLSLGSFYETEKDGEFCCETCPDEEKKLAQIENTTTSSDRKSFSEKLAIFQGSEKGLLQKSLSDEEKTKSLKRMNEEYLSSSSSDKKSVSNFMFDETDRPPALPTTKPPSEIISNNSESPQKNTPFLTPVNIEAKNNIVISSLSKDKEEPLEALTVSTKNVTKEEKVIKNISLEPQLLHQFKSQTEIQFCDDASASSLTVELNYTPEESSTDHSLEYYKKDIIEEETIIEKVPNEEIIVSRKEEIIEESENASYLKKEEEEIDKQPESNLVEEIKITEEVKKNEIEVRINEAIASVEEEVVIVIETEDKKEEKKIEETDEWKIEVTENKIEEEPEPEKKIEKDTEPVKKIEEIKIEAIDDAETVPVQPSTSYPTPLNPFGDDEEEVSKSELDTSRKSLNPFGSDDDDDDDIVAEKQSVKPKPRVSTNPFGSDTDDDDDTSASTSLKAPVPLPRMTVQSSPRSFTPEPSPRHQQYKIKEQLRSPDTNFIRNGSFRGSAHSLASSSGSGYSTVRHKKGKAPAPPISSIYGSINELYPPRSSMENSPSNSQNVSPKSTPKSKKKRPAPPPPTSTPKPLYEETSGDLTDSLKNTIKELSESNEPFKRKLIPLDSSLLDHSESSTQRDSDNVVYRRTIMPLSPDTTLTDDSLISEESKSDRQWEKMKDNKESQNAKRQSQVSLTNNEIDSIYSSKAAHGQWKRRKGPAPGLPIPPKKVIQMLPLQEIRHELEIIEVQQQGLEKQGVMLEKMIRDRCEGPDQPDEIVENVTNSKDVEDLIMQLFDLVNEKNDLFRRQAELMYLRRQHRLEQEQIDIEYEIRTLMAQPEQNKTDTDKEREESLIARLLEVVELRNEVVDCLEMDRLREHEEDLSIKQQIEIHTAKRDEEINQQTPTKLSKKEKKKQKEIKKLTKNKKMDADKDDDESELNTATKEKEKKKKKKFLF